MTGPEHYAEGERLLAQSESERKMSDASRLWLTRTAQAHFAAAQVAATVDTAAGGAADPWLAVIRHPETRAL